jgi:thioredoxin reductase
LSEVRDVTIVGAGPVGLFGAFYAGLRGMSVRVIDSLSEPGGQLTALYPDKPIYDMPGFPDVLASELAEGFMRQASRFDPEMVFETRCERLELLTDCWQIASESGNFLSKTVIVCAGVGAFTPTKLDVEREGEFLGKGLMYGVRSKSELAGKQVVIVGGGDSALDWALALENIAGTVTLVHRRDGFRAHEDSVRKLQASTVSVRLWEVVAELRGDGCLQSVVVENRQTKERQLLACDALVVNIGYKSSLGPLRNWGIELQGTKIVVNEKMETNLPGVYASGDICTHGGKLDLIATGVGEVCTAVNFAKTFIDPSAKAFPGHSSDMELPAIK